MRRKDLCYDFRGNEIIICCFVKSDKFNTSFILDEIISTDNIDKMYVEGIIGTYDASGINKLTMQDIRITEKDECNIPIKVRTVTATEFENLKKCIVIRSSKFIVP